MGAVSNRSFTTEGVRQLAIDHLGSGSVTIEPNPGADQVECSIDADDEQVLEQVQVRSPNGGLRLSFPREPHRDAAIHVRLSVPDGLDYAIKVGPADVTARAVIGRSKITSGSGDIRVGQATDLDCATGSGTIVVQSATGRGVRLASGSGDVTLDQAHCAVSAKSGSGRVTVRSVDLDQVQVSSGSGDILVEKTSGSVDLRTASGSVTVGVADGLPAWLDLESVTGEIRIGLGSTQQPPPGQPYVSVRARTASGDITIERA
jgi:Putative adhesin